MCVTEVKVAASFVPSGGGAPPSLPGCSESQNDVFGILIVGRFSSQFIGLPIQRQEGLYKWYDMNINRKSEITH